MRSSVLQGSGLIHKTSIDKLVMGQQMLVLAHAWPLLAYCHHPWNGKSATLLREGAYCPGVLLWEKMLADV
jgi:hypothetical protein